jgi:glycosyltransferase involved in cell wall biosynthesis
MRILQTIYDDIRNPWWGGGGAVRVFEISRRLARRHEITVVTGNFPGAVSEEEIEGVRYIRVGYPNNRWVSRLSFTVMANRWVRKANVDLWVNHFSAFSPVMIQKDPVILVFYHVVGRHALKKYPLIGIASWVAEEYTLRSHHHILTIAPSVEALIREKLDNREADIRCIFTGIDSSCFTTVPAEQNYILYLGRYDLYMKGIDTLLSAFSDVVKRCPAIRLKMAGRGKDLVQVKQIVHHLRLTDRVDLLGPISDEEKHRLLAGALMVCMPSRFEGWGIVAIEAGAAGKPVIGTTIPGLSDAIRDGETGLLVPPNSSKALSETILRLLDDPAERHRLGTNGRNYARNFDWDRIAEEEETYYLTVVSR